MVNAKNNDVIKSLEMLKKYVVNAENNDVVNVENNDVIKSLKNAEQIMWSMLKTMT